MIRAEMVNEISRKEKYINVLINSQYRRNRLSLYRTTSTFPLTFRRPSTPPYPLDHGVSQGNPDITSCPQTPEGLSQQMYSDTFERWLDTYRINTASYFFTSFAFLPLLAKAKTEGGAVEPGNILNISVGRSSKSKELRERCGG